MFKKFLLLFVVVCDSFACINFDESQAKAIYSVRQSTVNCSSYVYLCRMQAPETIFRRIASECDIDNGGELALGFITVDESGGPFFYLKNDTRGIIWSATVTFRFNSILSTSSIDFEYTYNDSVYPNSPLAKHLGDLDFVYSNIGCETLECLRDKHTFFRSDDGILPCCKRVKYLDSRGNLRLAMILKKALYRWKFNYPVSITTVLEKMSRLAADSSGRIPFYPKVPWICSRWICIDILFSIGCIRKDVSDKFCITNCLINDGIIGLSTVCISLGVEYVFGEKAGTAAAVLYASNECRKKISLESYIEKFLKCYKSICKDENKSFDDFLIVSHIQANGITHICDEKCIVPRHIRDVIAYCIETTSDNGFFVEEQFVDKKSQCRI